jgi:hypothetical protein
MSFHPKIDLIKAILACRPEAICSINNNDYDLIEWSDPRPKPSLNELEAVWRTIEKEVEFEVIRLKRNTLLSETDYTQLPDYKNSDKESWLKYRQELRDLPNKFSSVEEVVWPTKPK